MIISKSTVQKVRDMGYTVKYLDPEMDSAFEFENAFLNRPTLEDDTPVAFFEPDGTEVFPFRDRMDEYFWSGHYLNPPAPETSADLCCECIACKARRNFNPAAPAGTFKQYKLEKADGTTKGFIARIVDNMYIDGYNRPIFCRDDVPTELHAEIEDKTRHELSGDQLSLALFVDDPRVTRDDPN